MLEDSEKMKKVERMEEFGFWDERSSVRVRAQSEPVACWHLPGDKSTWRPAFLRVFLLSQWKIWVRNTHRIGDLAYNKGTTPYSCHRVLLSLCTRRKSKIAFKTDVADTAECQLVENMTGSQSKEI